jgi:glycosyltransferase involved in cell wall biosynthesis
MKILQINKFLYPMGGAETYMFKLSESLEDLGHEIKYWGMRDEKNIVEDEYDTFAAAIDYNNLNSFGKIQSAFSTIYSFENVNKINRFLDAWSPDIIHIHNYNFQLTAAILKVFNERSIKVVQTVHDSQMACPYHRLYNFRTKKTCVKCVEGSFSNCIKDRCFDNSIFKSTIGALESTLYHSLGYYNKYIDQYISPSIFLKKIIEKRIKGQILVLPNFVDNEDKKVDLSFQGSYYLFYGRISEEKGILDIIPVFEKLGIKLIIIGKGPQSKRIVNSKFIHYLGPKYGDELFEYVAKAKYVIQPSKGFENCPMTIVESFSFGIPVIGSNHSGFIELIKDEETGFIIDFTNPLKVEEGLKKAENNYSIHLRENAFKFHKLNLAKKPHLERIINIYENLISNE